MRRRRGAGSAQRGAAPGRWHILVGRGDRGRVNKGCLLCAQECLLLGPPGRCLAAAAGSRVCVWVDARGVRSAASRRLACVCKPAASENPFCWLLRHGAAALFWPRVMAWESIHWGEEGCVIAVGRSLCCCRLCSLAAALASCSGASRRCTPRAPARAGARLQAPALDCLSYLSVACDAWRRHAALHELGRRGTREASREVWAQCLGVGLPPGFMF